MSNCDDTKWRFRKILYDYMENTAMVLLEKTRLFLVDAKFVFSVSWIQFSCFLRIKET